MIFQNFFKTVVVGIMVAVMGVMINESNPCGSQGGLEKDIRSVSPDSSVCFSFVIIQVF